MSAPVPVTPEEIIDLILAEMQAEIAPMYYTNLVRSVYHVYLFSEDLERLSPVLHRVRDEAVRALNEELARLNRSQGRRWKLPLIDEETRKKRYESIGDWTVEFHENPDADARANPIVIHSAFALPPDTPDERAGTLTERVTKRNVEGQTSSTTRTMTAETKRAAGPVLAELNWEDERGPQSYQMVKEQIKIGRGATDRWVDLKLFTHKDVSREHAQIRRDPRTGQFFIKDLSSLGTTVNGKSIRTSIDRSDGQERDLQIEEPLPAKAKIGLAGVMFVQFEAAKK